MIITDKADVMGTHCLETQFLQLIVNQSCKYICFICRPFADYRRTDLVRDGLEVRAHREGIVPSVVFAIDFDFFHNYHV